ncbi:MAG TPA: hypothetical protein VGI43_02330 [Mucilaginibacter sp.]|jgi:hypothetical protein
MANAVTWVEIRVADFERAKKFYEFVFNIEMEFTRLNIGTKSTFIFRPWVAWYFGLLSCKRRMNDNKEAMC